MTRPEVSTTAGALLGERSSDGIAVFRGIPFAAAPTGPNRFRPPQPVEPWEGVRDASAFGKASVQRTAGVLGMFGAAEGEIDEDCLFLNVWTPSVDDGGKRPVLVWIHGGAFRMGAASLDSYDGAGLAARGDVVVVSINYRLGLLGFLAHPDLGANRGLLDQVAALEWVQREIAAFGGDPAQVTIFGESAGGKSVECLLGMPSARGLFRRAIAESTYDIPLDASAAAATAEKIASTLGVTVAGLRDAPLDDLLAAEAQALGMAAMGGGPVLDEATLPEAPIDVLRRGDRSDVELLLGTTLDEAALFGGFVGGAEELDDSTAAARLAATMGVAPEVGAHALSVYRKVRESLGVDASLKSLVSSSTTDRMFRQHSIRVAEAQSAHASTFMYLFTWSSPVAGLGACHGIELPFVFGTFDAPLARLSGDSASARSLSAAVQDAWLSFARTGAPSSAALPPWPAYDVDRRATMVLGESSAVADAPMDDIRRLWSTAG